MTLIANAKSSAVYSSGYIAQSFYLLPRKTNSIHHHPCPRRLEGDSLPDLLDFSSPRHQCLRMRGSATVLGLMFSLSATKRLPHTIRVSCHQEVYRWRVLCVISHQSHQVLFSLGIILLITQPYYDYSKMPPPYARIPEPLEQGQKIWVSHLCEFIKTTWSTWLAEKKHISIAETIVF